MKKITLLAILALGFSFTSCKKDRTCTCTIAVTEVATYNDNGDVEVETDAYTVSGIYKMTEISKTGASGACVSEKRVDKSTEDYGGGFTATFETTQDSDCSLD